MFTYLDNFKKRNFPVDLNFTNFFSLIMPLYTAEKHSVIKVTQSLVSLCVVFMTPVLRNVLTFEIVSHRSHLSCVPINFLGLS